MEKERRKYVRLNKIFPVELKIVDLHNNPCSGLLQGFTRDVSFEGVCLEINHFPEEHLGVLLHNQGKIILFINIPLKRNPVKAVARIAWSKKTASPYPSSYLLGITYEVIDKEEQRRIIRHAKCARMLPRLFGAGVAVLILFSLLIMVENSRLIRNNALLVQQLTQLADEQFQVTTELDRVEAEKIIIGNMLQRTTLETASLKNELAVLTQQQLQKEERENTAEIERLTRERQGLEQKLSAMIEEKKRQEERWKYYTQSQEALTERLETIKEKKTVLEDKSLGLMRQWLVSAQNSKTGLVVSYDNDIALLDVGFTYDQALSAFTFIHFQEFERAKKIFDFFHNRAPRIDCGFANAYDVITGKVSEYMVHSGPPIYLGLAILTYEHATKDAQYRPLACEIGDWLLSLQQAGKEGALPGGPALGWVSTEQNIAGQVFFSRLYQFTNDERYAIGARSILLWLKNYGYNGKLKRFNRGENDHMIATDAIALSIMAFGPDKLQDMGVAIDDLIACVEENCRTMVTVKNVFGRKMNVTGYDFSCPSSVGRAGTIAVEWTAQMIVAYRELERFYAQKANLERAQGYRRKAQYYLGELEKLMLVRSAFGQKKGSAGMPYASGAGIDTGHGWITPDNGSISAAGTNFAIFAKEEYNMLQK